MPLRRPSYDLLLVFTKGVNAKDAADLTHHLTGDFRLDQATGLEGQTVVGIPEVGRATMKRVREAEAGISGASALQASFWNYGVPAIKVAPGESSEQYIKAEAILIVSPPGP